MKRAYVAAVAIGVSAVAWVGVAVAGTAHAATNGQQLKVCIRAEGKVADYQEINLKGMNQNGVEQTVTRGANGLGCYEFLGSWWVGNVHVNGTKSPSKLEDLNDTCFAPGPGAADIIECDVSRDTPADRDGGGGVLV